MTTTQAIIHILGLELYTSLKKRNVLSNPELLKRAGLECFKLGLANDNEITIKLRRALIEMDITGLYITIKHMNVNNTE